MWRTGHFATLFGSNWGTDVPKRLTINSGVTVGGTGSYALRITGSMSGTLTLENYGSIQGKGGSANGGNGGTAVQADQTAQVSLSLTTLVARFTPVVVVVDKVAPVVVVPVVKVVPVVVNSPQLSLLPTLDSTSPVVFQHSVITVVSWLLAAITADASFQVKVG